MNNYTLKIDEMSQEFTSGQIEHFADDFDGDQAAAVLYLWLFHHFSTCPEELKNNGRAMYKNLVQTLRPMIERSSLIEKQEQLEAQKKEHCIAIEELKCCLFNCRYYFKSNGLQYFVEKINQTLERYNS